MDEQGGGRPGGEGPEEEFGDKKCTMTPTHDGERQADMIQQFFFERGATVDRAAFDFVVTEIEAAEKRGEEGERERVQLLLRNVEHSMEIAAIGIEGTPNYDLVATKWYKAGMHNVYVSVLQFLSPTNTV